MKHSTGRRRRSGDLISSVLFKTVRNSTRTVYGSEPKDVDEPKNGKVIYNLLEPSIPPDVHDIGTLRKMLSIINDKSI